MSNADKAQEFFDRYEGESIDYDGAYGAQSPDLALKYIEHMTGDLKLAKSLMCNAIDMADPGRFAALKEYADLHTVGLPQVGDLVVVRLDMPYGSVGVLSGDVKRRGHYRLFTQNPGPASDREFTTRSNPFVGWWRFR